MINIQNNPDIMYGKETDEFMIVFQSLMFSPKYFSIDDSEVCIFDENKKYFSNIPYSSLLKHLNIKSIKPYILKNKVTFVNLREQDNLIKETSFKVSELVRIHI